MRRTIKIDPFGFEDKNGFDVNTTNARGETGFFRGRVHTLLYFMESGLVSAENATDYRDTDKIEKRIRTAQARGTDGNIARVLCCRNKQQRTDERYGKDNERRTRTEKTRRKGEQCESPLLPKQAAEDE